MRYVMPMAMTEYTKHIICFHIIWSPGPLPNCRWVWEAPCAFTATAVATAVDCSRDCSRTCNTVATAATAVAHRHGGEGWRATIALRHDHNNDRICKAYNVF